MTEYCKREIMEINHTRLRYLIPPTMFAVIVILAVYFVNVGQSGFTPLISAYILADVLYLLFLIGCFFILRGRMTENEKQFGVLLHLIFFVSLLWAAVLSLLDQQGFNSMTCYIMAALLLAFALVIKPGAFIILQLSVLAPLFIALPYFQANSQILFGDYMNALFCSILSVFISRFAYTSVLDRVISNKIIEREANLTNDARERFEMVWSNLECGISIIDAETRKIVDINPLAVRMFGGKKTDLIGRRCHVCICPAEESSCPILDLNQTVDRSERKFIRANGEIIPILKSVSKVKYDNRIYLLESFIDLSKFKRAEEQLRLMSITEKVNQVGSDFLSRTSYGIRTPLNAIVGMLRIAETTYNTEKLKSCLATIEQSSMQLLNFINEMFDMPDIEKGKTELINEPMSLEDILKKICNSAIKQMEQKEQKLNVFFEKNACIQFLGDESKISLVISNLVSNAVKFTPANGEITIAVTEKERNNKSSTVVFSVKDTGIGMTEEQKEKLFYTFEQTEIGISGRFEGTSLGLAISNSFIEKMGGKIWVESEVGKGSNFNFELELNHADYLGEENFIAAADGVKVLVASNDEEIRRHFKSVISGRDITTETAENQREIFTKIRAAYNKKKPYDIIFLDYNLQKDDIFDLAYRVLERAEADSIVIMAPASIWDTIDIRMRSEGINGFLSLPLFPSNIINCLRRKGIIEVNSEISNEIQIRSKIDFSNINLLLTDDVEIDREIFKALLESTNINIDTAENGRIAVEMFKNNPEKYDIIIMDIHMPEMDGYEATKAIRSLGDSKAGTIPIIAVTANAFREDVEKCLACGMNSHIAKPVDVSIVIRKISEYTAN